MTSQLQGLAKSDPRSLLLLARLNNAQSCLFFANCICIWLAQLSSCLKDVFCRIVRALLHRTGDAIPSKRVFVEFSFKTSLIFWRGKERLATRSKPWQPVTMQAMPDLIVLLVAEPTFLVAYTVFGMVGFGTTLVAAPILGHLLPVSALIPALALLDLIAASSTGLKLGTHVEKKEVKRLLPPMICGSAFGTYILFAVPIKILMLLLGVFVVLYALNGLTPKSRRPPVSSRWAWWYGVTGGVLSALFGAGGWVYSIYLVRRLDDPKAIRGTQVAVLTASAFIRVTLFAVAGRYFDLDLLVLVMMLLPAMALGLAIGNRMTLRMDKNRFMQVLYSVLLVTGTSLVVRAVAL